MVHLLPTPASLSFFASKKPSGGSLPDAKHRLIPSQLSQAHPPFYILRLGPTGRIFRCDHILPSGRANVALPFDPLPVETARFGASIDQTPKHHAECLLCFLFFFYRHSFYHGLRGLSLRDPLSRTNTNIGPRSLPQPQSRRRRSGFARGTA